MNFSKRSGRADTSGKAGPSAPGGQQLFSGPPSTIPSLQQPLPKFLTTHDLPIFVDSGPILDHSPDRAFFSSRRAGRAPMKTSDESQDLAIFHPGHRATSPLEATLVGEAAATALAMVTSLNRHDRGTRDHCERVGAYAEMLAEETGWATQFMPPGNITSAGTVPDIRTDSPERKFR